MNAAGRHSGRFFLILLLAMLLAFALSLLTTTRLLRQVMVVEVPDLTGQTMEAARSRLRAQRLAIDISEFRFDLRIPANQIITQDPAAGQKVKTGRVVRVVVSRGSQTVKVPEVLGLNLTEAGLALGRKGLNPGKSTRLYSPEAPKNAVLDQWPAPDQYLNQGGRVDLLVSLGPRPVRWLMPALAGWPLAEATRLLGQLGLDLQSIQRRVDDQRPSGAVLEQTPPAGERVEAHDVAGLVIASGSTDSPLAGRYVTVKFRVPPGSAELRIKMSVRDESGLHQVYNDMERPNAELAVPFTVYGSPATVTISVNGNVVEERQL